MTSLADLPYHSATACPIADHATALANTDYNEFCSGYVYDAINSCVKTRDLIGNNTVVYNKFTKDPIIFRHIPTNLTFILPQFVLNNLSVGIMNEI